MLIADDDVQLLEYYQSIFEQDESLNFLRTESVENPFVVHTFSDGAPLVDFFLAGHARGQRIPLCLLDMRMTTMDGLTAAEKIRIVDPEVMIIIITAYTDVSPAEIRSRLQENIYYVKKPFNEDELYSLVTSLLKNWNIRQALRESEGNYRRLLEKSNEGILTIDASGKITFANATLGRMLGYNLEEMGGQSFFKFMDTDHANLVKRKIAQRIQGLSERYELELIRQDNQVLTAMLSASPIYTGNGAFYGSFCVITDISETKKGIALLRKANEELAEAERIARENEHWLDNILRSVLTGIFIVDAQTHEILYANEIACQLTGQTEEKLVGLVCHRCVCPADVGKCPITDLGQTVDHSEWILLNVSGEQIPIIKNVVRMNFKGRDILLESFINITERKRMEQQLLTAKSTLEERVQKRTQELQDQIAAKEKALSELASAQSKLLEMSRAAGMAEVATGVLHNVGNVLNSVNVSCTLIRDQLEQSRIGNVARVAGLLVEPEGGLTRFLMEDPRGRQIPAYLASLAPVLEDEQQLLLRETLSLRDRVEHIKEIVVMQQNYGRVSGVEETIPVEQLLEDAVTFNSEALARHGITVHRQYQPVPPITVDKHKVLQILLNLISNAKYACTEDGRGGEKCIILRVFSPDPQRVLIQIEDNGMGIPPENLSRIFQHGFTTRKTGHGFGLHSGALAARELSGNLTAQSEGQGAGAVFTLDLPYKQGDKYE
ncbi:MAG: PAS domain S-box protein [Smithella sp.]